MSATPANAAPTPSDEIGDQVRQIYREQGPLGLMKLCAQLLSERVPAPTAPETTAEQAAPAAVEAGREPIYQVRNTFLSDPPNVWRDAEVFAYDVSPEEDRRIVYAAPAVVAEPPQISTKETP